MTYHQFEAPDRTRYGKFEVFYVEDEPGPGWYWQVVKSYFGDRGEYWGTVRPAAEGPYDTEQQAIEAAQEA